MFRHTITEFEEVDELKALPDGTVIMGGGFLRGSDVEVTKMPDGLLWVYTTPNNTYKCFYKWQGIKENWYSYDFYIDEYEDEPDGNI